MTYASVTMLTNVSQHRKPASVFYSADSGVSRAAAADGRRTVINGRSVAADGGGTVADGRPAAADSRGTVVDGQPAMADGWPAVADGRGTVADGCFCTIKYCKADL